MIKNLAIPAIAAAFMALPLAAQAAVTTVGPGGVDDGWATTITYEDDNAIARRGVTNGRDNPLNALGGPADGNFFEIGFGSTVDLTFGRDFRSDVTVFEITFGDPTAFPESVDVYAIAGAGPAEMVGSITNVAASGGAMLSLAGLSMELYDTIRLVDTSPLTSSFESDALGPLGGFDIDSVRVNIVPLPAGGLLLLTALGAFGVARSRKKA